jgi:phosphoribosylglycinamide formyltransferase-1
MRRLGVLGSGKGSNYVAIQEAIRRGTLHAEVAVVVSDRADAGILDHARAYGVPTAALPPSRFKTRLEPELEEELVRILQRHQVELVVLAGYMRVVKEPLLRAFPRKIINIHPSLLPDFKGLAAWEQALKAGVARTGCTVHYVNEDIDAGEILGQATVPVLADDTAELLHARIQEAEHRLYPEILGKLLREN